MSTPGPQGPPPRSPGWYPDPTGRFPARYHDGGRWTDQVTGADGQVVADTFASAQPMNQPMNQPMSQPMSQPAPGPMPQRPMPAYAGPPQVPQQRGANGRAIRLIGTATAVLGALVAVIGLTAVNWSDQDDSTFADFHDNVDGATSPDGAEFMDRLTLAYAQWLGWLFLGLVVVAVIAAVVVALTREVPGARVVVAVIASTAAFTHAVVIARIFRGDDLTPEIGAWFGTVGYLMVAFGLVLGPVIRRPQPRPPLPY